LIKKIVLDSLDQFKLFCSSGILLYVYLNKYILIVVVLGPVDMWISLWNRQGLWFWLVLGPYLVVFLAQDFLSPVEKTGFAGETAAGDSDGPIHI
jgi:hypothetical protein